MSVFALCISQEKKKKKARAPIFQESGNSTVPSGSPRRLMEQGLLQQELLRGWPQEAVQEPRRARPAKVEL